MSKHQSKFRLSAVDEEHLRLTSLFNFKFDISCSISCSYISSLYLEFDADGSQALRGLQQVKGHCHKFYQQFLHKYYINLPLQTPQIASFKWISVKTVTVDRKGLFRPPYAICNAKTITFFSSVLAHSFNRLSRKMKYILKRSFNKGSPRLIKILWRRLFWT